jgi:hypothetical protein
VHLISDKVTMKELQERVCARMHVLELGKNKFKGIFQLLNQASREEGMKGSP